MSLWLPAVALGLLWSWWRFSRPMVYEGVLWGELGNHLPNLLWGGRGTRVEVEAGGTTLAIERGRGSARHVILRLDADWPDAIGTLDRMRRQRLRCSQLRDGKLRVAVRRGEVMPGWICAIRTALDELGVVPGTPMKLTYKVVKRGRLNARQYEDVFRALALRGEGSLLARFGKAGLEQTDRNKREAAKYDQ